MYKKNKVSKSKVEVRKEIGLFKFVVPNESERIQAIGLTGESTFLKKIITKNINNFYEVIENPQDGDWLKQHKEFGQTYTDFQYSCNKNNPKNIIYLVSLSFCNKNQMNSDFINSFKILCDSYFYGFKFKLVHKMVNLIYDQIKTKMNVDTGKIQLCANQIISILSKEIFKDAYAIVAFTDQDLYQDNIYEKTVNVNKNNLKDSIKNNSKNVDNSNEKDRNSNENEIKIEKEKNENNHSKSNSNSKEKIEKEEEEKINFNNIMLSNSYTYHVTDISKKICVFSFSRFDPLFYHNFNNDNSAQDLIHKFFNILLKRSVKLLVYKIGHLIGLKNCIYYKCIMNGYFSLEEFDNKPIELCPICLRKTYSILIHISNPKIIYDRFIKLKNVYENYFSGVFDLEKQWLNDRIEDLEEEIYDDI